ncbi:SCO4402 family protein [Streptomyces collinus]|uniref:SCO4402 family protein n=1 Tax=Streptomyces collinus TaxID=42684 RepID=UPI0036A41349
MTDYGIEFPVFRLHVVPAVLALASPSWQRDVWLCPEEFENLDHVVNVLFDDFCNANDPAPWLGKSLRTEEEVALMKELGKVYSTVQEEVGRGTADEVYLDAPAWGTVIAVAGRLAQVMVTNDIQAAALLQEQLSLPSPPEAR